MEYKPTIGLEIHVELKTLTKMFCSCKNDTDEKRPNINICPVCTGHPGTLPAINKEAVKHLMKVGLSVGGKISKESEFDRKNYFYPDIPKGYQISQYKYPFVSGGELAGVSLTRIHLEEDTARSSHEKASAEGYSLVDFNRAGVPLMELVTEPVIKSAKEAADFAKELQLLLQYLGVANANMEKGEMRVEANISVSNTDKFGTKVEIKNLNSFRSVERAIEFEIERQKELLDSGGKVVQETRGWDESKQTTFSQRAKEDSHDYRYFPDPDLPKINLKEVPEFGDDAILSQSKETPNGKRLRFSSVYKIKEGDINFYIYNTELSDFFEKAFNFLKNKDDAQLLSNYTVSDLAGISNWSDIKPDYLAEVISMLSEGKISSRGAKNIIIEMAETKNSPSEIAEKLGLFQNSNESDLENTVKSVIENNKNVVEQYKNGKTAAMQFLVGQAMKSTKGSANPQVLRSILEKILVK